MLGAIYWLKQRFPLFTSICLSQPSHLLAVQNWKKKRNQVTFGGSATTLIARGEAVTIIYLAFSGYLTQLYIPSSKEGKHGLDEMSVKWVQKCLENFIHKVIISCFLTKEKELLTAVLQKVFPATDTLINGIIEQRPHFSFCRWYQAWRDCEATSELAQASEWSWQMCENCLTFPISANSVQQRQAQLTGNKCRKGDDWFGSSSAESDLRITGDEKKNMNQHCAKKANIIRRCINRSLKYRPVKIVPLLHLAR